MRTPVVALFGTLLLLPLPVAAQNAAQTPTQFYNEYRDVWLKAKSIDPVLPYLAKANRAEIEATPKDKRQMMFNVMKMMGNVTNVKVVEETRQGNGYVLDMTAMDLDRKPMKGTAHIIREGGAMKLMKETWTS